MIPPLFHKGDRKLLHTRRFLIVVAMALAIFIVVLPTGEGLTQEIAPIPVAPQTSDSSSVSADGLFLVDVIVRGQPVLLGAEFTKVFAKQHGSTNIPSQYAVSVFNAEQERAPKPKRLHTAFRQFCRRRPRE